MDLDTSLNFEVDPQIQFFTEELEDEEPEQRQYFCSICKSILDLLEGTKTIWICSNCTQTYDTSIQESPLKNISGQRIKTYPEFEYYQVYDETDPNLIFVEGIDLSEQGNTPKNVDILRDDGFRIRHIRVRGSPVKSSIFALSFIAKNFSLSSLNVSLDQRKCCLLNC